MQDNLKKTYAAAVKKLGAELTRAIACSFGAVTGDEDDVPAERRHGLAAALNRILNGGQMTTAQAKTLAHGEHAAGDEVETQDEVFAAIRSKAYSRADDEEPKKPAVVIDPVAIFTRWNESKPKPTNG